MHELNIKKQVQVRPLITCITGAQLDPSALQTSVKLMTQFSIISMCEAMTDAELLTFIRERTEDLPNIEADQRFTFEVYCSHQ